ncbi:hypothetical protein TWF281_007561 [Arthrobotrys megalospora]
MCPPSCPTALILDKNYGIFYPASIYPVPTATFVSLKALLECIKTSRHFGSNQPQIRHYRTAISSEPQYSTVWCSHHRCPPSLMAENYSKRRPSAGSTCLWNESIGHTGWQDYDQRWGHIRRAAQLSPCNPWCGNEQTKYLVGYRQKHTASKVRSPNGPRYIHYNGSYRASKDGLEPAYEVFFYDTICRHCLLPLPRGRRSGQVVPWSHIACKCLTPCQSPDSLQKRSGCHRCGVVTMKFTMIEAFEPVLLPSKVFQHLDYKIAMKLFLASEVGIEFAPTATGVLQKRLIPAHPEEVQQAIKFIRSGPIIPLPLAPRRGLNIQDLPSPLLDKIISYVLTETKFSDDPKYIAFARTVILQGRGAWDGRGKVICIACEGEGRASKPCPMISECSECYYDCWKYLVDGMPDST